MKKTLQILTAIIAVSSSMLRVNAQSSQESAATKDLRKSSINVFFDCITCDMNYIREEMPFVNYVRDVKEAQVYIRVTRQNTASGGEKFTVSFEGLLEFNGMNDTLEYSSNPDETTAITRTHQVKVLKTGLMRFVAHTPIIDEIQIVHSAAIKAEKVVDKWNNWVFELSTSPNWSSEETYKSLNLRNSVSVSKVTQNIKFEVDVNHSYFRQKQIYGSIESVYVRKSESINTLFVKSLGEHWSVGAKWLLSASTMDNFDMKHEIMPSIEYDFYPYSEATHRQLRVLYSIGYQGSNYIDSSKYDLLVEHRPRNELSIGYMVQEKWGSINLTVTAGSYLHDLSKYRVESGGTARLRLFKGLSLTLSANAAYIKDALNQRKPNAISEADRLLRLKQMETSFELGGSVGITYTFGSIYNNVVNPRFNSYNTSFRNFNF